MNFQVMFENGNYIINQFITTDIDLLEVYKNSLITGCGHIVWNEGVIDCKRVVGVLRQPDYNKGK